MFYTNICRQWSPGPLGVEERTKVWFIENERQRSQNIEFYLYFDKYLGTLN